MSIGSSVARGLTGIDAGELSLRELADVAMQALEQTVLHGSPPEGEL